MLATHCGARADQTASEFLQLPSEQAGEESQDQSGQLQDLLKGLTSTWAEAPAELLSRFLRSLRALQLKVCHSTVMFDPCRAASVLGATKGHEVGEMPKRVYILNVDVRKGGDLLWGLRYLLPLPPFAGEGPETFCDSW